MAANDSRTGVATTSWGRPVGDMRNSVQAGDQGYVLMQDVQTFEKNAHFNRERIPERVVHANGTGAFGAFTCTDSAYMRSICKADLFASEGKTADLFVRFSGVVTERGGADSDREPRGFAAKFYTSEGNWDLVCNNIPVFFIRDPSLFPDLNHAQKRNPKTDLRDANAFWDFMSHTPESVHAVTMLFGDRGVPYSLRNMNGYGNHSFKCVNARGEVHWVKFHIRADAGSRNLSSEAAETMRGRDADWLKRDLFYYIENGGAAKYGLFVQAIPDADVARLPYDIFDVTKVVPHGDYPLHRIGTIALNRNPNNFFEDVEQAAFSPGNLVPGIEASPDKVFQARLLSYQDAQRYRVGVNFSQLNVNRPHCPVRNEQRDGLMVQGQPGPVANYFTGDPASGGGQGTDPNALESAYPLASGGTVGRQLPKKTLQQQVDDYYQPRVLFLRVMTEAERSRLCGNIAAHLQNARPEVQERQLSILRRVDQSYGDRVAALTQASMANKIQSTASMGASSQPTQLFAAKTKAGNEIISLPLGSSQTAAEQPAQTFDAFTSGGGSGAAGDVRQQQQQQFGSTIYSGWDAERKEKGGGNNYLVTNEHLSSQAAAAGVSLEQHPLMSGGAKGGAVKTFMKQAMGKVSQGLAQMTMQGDSTSQIR